MARNQIHTPLRQTIRAAKPLLFMSLEKKKIEDIVLKKRIIEYSAIKIKVNPMAPYSILNPDTSSDSPSEKSKGVRLVSATQEIIHRTHSRGAIMFNGLYRFNLLSL